LAQISKWWNMSQVRISMQCVLLLCFWDVSA
jgi:hypothetical protein